jgi:hypothetical protein
MIIGIKESGVTRMSTIVFAFSIFCGWLIFDIVKQRKVTIDIIISSLIVALIAGIFWWILDLLFNEI